jgi:hypothetical protein
MALLAILGVKEGTTSYEAAFAAGVISPTKRIAPTK